MTGRQKCAAEIGEDLGSEAMRGLRVGRKDDPSDHPGEEPVGLIDVIGIAEEVLQHLQCGALGGLGIGRWRVTGPMDRLEIGKAPLEGLDLPDDPLRLRGEEIV
jgi:hypothetical protein